MRYVTELIRSGHAEHNDIYNDIRDKEWPESKKVDGRCHVIPPERHIGNVAINGVRF